MRGSDVTEVLVVGGGFAGGRIAAGWPGVYAQILGNIGAELIAFRGWAEGLYLRPHHRSAALLDSSTIDTPRISRKRSS